MKLVELTRLVNFFLCLYNMERIIPEIKNYDWGRHSSVSAAEPFVVEQGRVAELWWGSHPSGPAISVETGQPIPTMGYLLKLLTVAKALSIQVHPDRTTAKKLHAADPRHYPDDGDKPEMAVAITTFEAFCGFRPFSDSRCALENVGLTGESTTQFIRMVLEWSTEERHLVYQRLGKDMGQQQEMNMFRRLQLQFPNDPGVLIASFLMNYVVLAPGQVLAIAPNEVHAYLSGDAIELMASSDNVIRLGLTTKFVDKDAFFKVADLMSSRPAISNGLQMYPRCTVYNHQFLPHVQLCICVALQGETFVMGACKGVLIILEGVGTLNETTPIKAGESFVLNGSQLYRLTAEQETIHAVFTRST